MGAEDLTNTNESTNSFVSDEWAGLILELAPDRMLASLTGMAPPGADKATIQGLLSKLIRKSGLVFGLQAIAVRQAVDILLQGETLDNYVIARGKLAQPGQDARIEVLLPGKEKPSEDDMVQGLDFRDRGDLPLVNQGDAIARLVREVPFTPGKDVLGGQLLGNMPRMLKLNAGKGLELKEDDTLLLATANGMLVRPDEDKFEIIDTLEIHGDVDFSVGHVDFPGLVKVAGTVLTGFKVNAYSLEVDALESGSQVEVQGDLKVKQGVMDAQIKAGGNIYAYFIRQGQVECEGDVLVSAEIVQSVVRAKGRVITTSENGRIVNSRITGVSGVQTANLVNTGQEDSQVRIGMDKEFESQLSSLRQQTERLSKEKQSLLGILADQEPDLNSMETELKELIVQLADTKEEKARENLLAQINMIKPLRHDMRASVAGLNQQLETVEYGLNRLQFKMKDMLALAPVGVVRFTVINKAYPGTIIFTPRARLVLEQTQSNFSASEVEVKDKTTGQISVQIRLGAAKPIKV